MFVHETALERAGIDPEDLTTGARVTFEVDEDDGRGPRAAMIELVPDDGRRDCRGEVDKWFPERGFGFIRRDNGERVFLRRDDAPGDIEPGDRVRFDIRVPEDRTRHHLRAVRVVRD